jgi:hypothetical protein
MANNINTDNGKIPTKIIELLITNMQLKIENTQDKISDRITEITDGLTALIDRFSDLSRVITSLLLAIKIIFAITMLAVGLSIFGANILYKKNIDNVISGITAEISNSDYFDTRIRDVMNECLKKQYQNIEQDREKEKDDAEEDKKVNN